MIVVAVQLAIILMLLVNRFFRLSLQRLELVRSLDALIFKVLFLIILGMFVITGPCKDTFILFTLGFGFAI